MKHASTPHPLTWLALLSVAPFAFAAEPSVSAPAATSPASSEEEAIVELTPFIVDAGEDRGYQAQSALTGSRIKTALKDIASPTSSFTEQFLLDTAITDTDELARYMLSTEYDFGEDAGGQNRLFSGTARPLRMRGLGGGEVTTNFFRTGGRGNAFSLERVDQARGPNAILFGVGNPGGIINATTKRARLNANSSMVSAQVRSYGGTRIEGDHNHVLIQNRLAFRVAAVQGRANSWRNHQFSDEDRFFGTVKFRLSPKTEINAEAETGRSHRRANRTFTALDAYTPWAAAGKPISSTVVPTIERTANAATTWLVFDSASRTLMNRSASMRTSARGVVGGDPTLTDFSVLPRETAILGDGMGQDNKSTRLTAFINHAFTPALNVEVAAMRLDDHFLNVDAQQNISQFLRADPSPTLPTGAPNPNVGRAFLEAQTQRNYRDSRTDAVRASGSYKFSLGKFFGTHTLAGVVEYNFDKMTGVQLREFVTSSNAPNIVTPENNNNRIWRRTYVDLSGPSNDIVLADWRLAETSGLTDPVSGRTYQTSWIPFGNSTQFTSTEGTSAIGLLQSAFWSGRINTVVGMSRDERTAYNSTLARTPLTGFTNGILTPVRDHTGSESSAQNITFSGVFHATRWLGLTFSKAQNSGLPNATSSIPSADGTRPNQRPPRPEGRSEDFGFKLDLFEKRLFVSALYFQTTAANDFDFSPPVTQASVNSIWDALAANGIPDPLTNAPIISPRDVLAGSTFSSRTQGYELDLTANPLPNWRIFLNYSRTKTARTNIAPELVNYIAKQRGYWTEGDRSRLYLPGRGTGLAPQERDGNTTVDTIAEQLDVIDNAILNNITLADGRRPLGQIPQKLNFRTSFDFVKGPLKGFGIGGATRWTDRPIVRFVSPATLTSEPVVAYGPRQIFADINIGYRRKLTLLRHSVTWSIQLNINNLFDNDRYIVLRQNAAGETLNYRFNDPREWILTNRFTF